MLLASSVAAAGHFICVFVQWGILTIICNEPFAVQWHCYRKTFYIGAIISAVILFCFFC